MWKIFGTGIAITLALIIMARYYFIRNEVLVGDLAVEIAFNDLNGSDRKLSDFRNRFVILDFWGSWCIPCRESNAKLVTYYKHQNPGQIKIISVGIEKDRLAWKKAITEDSLFWVEQFTPLHMFDNEVANTYMVSQTPTYFLISPDQIIIAKSGKIDQIIDKFEDIN